MEFIIEDGEYEQIRLTVNEFRDVEYLHIRKYYLDFDGEWQPTQLGISMPLTIEIVRSFMRGIMAMLSEAESKAILEENFKDILDELYK